MFMLEYNELKKMYDEYYMLKRNIKNLIKSNEILTSRGHEKYNHYKNRHNNLKQILEENNIIREDING